MNYKQAVIKWFNNNNGYQLAYYVVTFIAGVITAWIFAQAIRYLI